VSDPRLILKLLLPISAFGLVLAFWFAGVIVWRAKKRLRRDKLQERLDLTPVTSEDERTLRLWCDGKEETLNVPGKKTKKSLVVRLDEMRARAGLEAPLKTVLLALVGGSLLMGSGVLLVTQNVVGAIGAAAAVVVICWVIFKNRIRRQVALFETQFLDALGLAARSLRAGHPLSGAFQVVAEEIAAPVGPMFASISQKQELGMKLEDALRDVGNNSNNHDMRIFATSVAIHLRSGGNLADLVDRLSSVIRDRMRLGRRVRVLTASAQLGKRVLIALPIVMFAAINVMNPAYLEPLYATSQGKMLLMFAIMGLMLGSWVMGRMARLKY